MSDFSDVLKDFLVESYENLDQLDRDLVTLEQDPESKPVLSSVFRTIHTIKGTCGFLGFSKLESVTHAGENLLSKLRDGEIRLKPDITTGLLSLVDAVRQILASIEEVGAEGEEDYTRLIRSLVELQEAALRGESAAATKDQQRAPAPSNRSSSADVSSVPVPPGDRPAPLPPAAKVDDEHVLAESRSGGVSESTIRVDVGLLDKLMNRVGELVLARNQILQFAGSQADSAFLNTSQRLNLITTELQEGVMKTRMQPIGIVWSKFPRVVRDLAVTCGKKIRIEMEGKETELDKTIIEAIKDPLTHVVRNSVDHGVESPEERRKCGKPEEGSLLLRAFHEGGQVNIEISDDGAGLNLERIKHKAVERGLVSAEQAARMSDRDIAQLVFAPGFSTAAKVTNVSGRGVGMDVVKTNIEKIGGTVDIQSQPGKGTTIKLKIPLTLAIIPALVVTCGGDRYAIPQVSLLELVRLEGEQAKKGIERLHGAPVYRLRGKLLPLVYLSRELGLDENAQSSRAKAASVDKLRSRIEGIDFRIAREAHLSWKARLRDFLDGKGSLKLEQATSHHDCLLGKWLYGEGLRDFGHLPDVQRLEKTHDTMHGAVRQVIKQKQDGNQSSAEEWLNRVEELSLEVVGLLDSLERRSETANVVNIVVLRADDRQFGLVVDAINDTEEIVVKPLSKQLKGIPVYAGATIMGDGKVALILDVTGMAQRAKVIAETRDRNLSTHGDREQDHAKDRQALLILLVGCRRVALPLSMVARLEEIQRPLVERADGREVVQYREQIMPLVRLSGLLGEPSSEGADQPLQVVVYSHQGKSVGLVVDRIADIVETDFNVRRQTEREGLLASVVIQNRVTDLLDVPEIIRRADPSIFGIAQAV